MSVLAHTESASFNFVYLTPALTLTRIDEVKREKAETRAWENSDYLRDRQKKGN